MKIIIDGVSGTWTEDKPEAVLQPGYVSEHFRYSEFDCNHCGEYGDRISLELVDVLEKVREYFHSPITPNSGVRCDYHNHAVGGATNSRHKIEHADAADIVVLNVSPNLVHEYLVSMYPDLYGIGKYNSFTHIDVRPGGSARW